MSITSNATSNEIFGTRGLTGAVKWRPHNIVLVKQLNLESSSSFERMAGSAITWGNTADTPRMAWHHLGGSIQWSLIFIELSIIFQLYLIKIKPSIGLSVIVRYQVCHKGNLETLLKVAGCLTGLQGEAGDVAVSSAEELGVSLLKAR